MAVRLGTRITVPHKKALIQQEAEKRGIPLADLRGTMTRAGALNLLDGRRLIRDEVWYIQPAERQTAGR